MKFEDFNDVDENEENEIVYKSLAKSKDYDDDDDIIVAGQNSLPDPVVGYLKILEYHLKTCKIF